VRVAALYDIHGNLPALDAVIADVAADVIVVGGDAVAGPWPAETLERLRSLGDRVRFIRGNADREVFDPPADSMAPVEAMAFVRDRLSAEQRAFLASWPETLSIDGVLYCHATPRSDEELLTRISSDERWLDALAGVAEQVVVCGHTHTQFDRRVGATRLVNAGSVGMPYEDEAGAYWALIGADVEHRRTVYEPGDIAGSGWPVEWPVATADEATEFFEKASLGKT
jgi:putative phosphoesterase